MERFIHLHTHTVFTHGNSVLTVEELVRQTKEFGMGATAIVDSGNIDGFKLFSSECQRRGIKPIYGCGFYLAKGTRFDPDAPVSHLVILVKNRHGMKNLRTLVELSKDSIFAGKPRIDDEILSEFNEGLICMTGGLGGDIDKLIVAGELAKAESRIEFYRSLFRENFYLELQDHGVVKNRKVIEQLIVFSEKLKIPTVATQGAFYLNKEDAVTCNELRKRAGNKSLATAEFYYKDSDSMSRLFASYPESLANVCKIATECFEESKDLFLS